MKFAARPETATHSAMKSWREWVFILVVFASCRSFAGEWRGAESSSPLNPPRFEFALESGYLFGVFDPPQDYQIAAEFLAGRVRWGVIDRTGWLRGYNQFYIS